MEQIAAIMILVGCGGGTTDCQQMPAPAVAYETVADCRDQLKPAMTRAMDGTNAVYGTCAKVDPAVLERDATVQWALSDEGEIAVTVIDEDMRTARANSVVASR